MKTILSIFLLLVSFQLTAQSWTNGQYTDANGNAVKWAGIIGSGDDYVYAKPQLILRQALPDKFLFYITDAPPPQCANLKASITIDGASQSFDINCVTNSKKSIWILNFPSYKTALAFTDLLMADHGTNPHVNIRLHSDCGSFNSKYMLHGSIPAITQQFGGLIQDIKQSIGY